MKVLTNLELEVVVRELNEKILDSKVSKIFLPETKILRLELYKSNIGKYSLIIDSGKGIYLSEFKLENPTLPPAFAMFLRRHLNNSILKRIELQKGERIVELVFQTKIGEKKLISELHGKGNFILTDSKNKIINSAVIVETPKKNVKKGQIYTYTRSEFDIRNVTLHDFTEASKNWSGTSIIKFLASGLKLGKIYAGEICNQTKLDSEKDIDLLSKSEIKALHSELCALLRKFDSGNSVLTENNAFPFKLIGYSGKGFDSFNESLDNLYSRELEKKAQEKHKLTYGRAAVKLEKNIEKQESLILELDALSKKNQSLIKLIYENYEIISNIIGKINSARLNYSWDEVEIALKKSAGAEMELLTKINRESNSIILNLNGHSIEFDLDSKIENLINGLYGKTKKILRKIEGAKKILSEFRNKNVTVSKPKPELKRQIKREWFEKFRWFYTSNGILAIGGRDATSNEVLIKKHLEIGDIVFHTEMSGSPFFILKGGRDADKLDINEVAIATASYSRAWKLSMMDADVFYVNPEQISKKANPGEYLNKGSFMVRGKRNFLNVKLEVSVGSKDGKVIGGPTSAISSQVDDYFTLIPGERKKSDITKVIALKLKHSSEEVIRFVPNGESKLL